MKKHLESSYLLLPDNFAKQMCTTYYEVIANLASSNASGIKYYLLVKINNKKNPNLSAKLEQLYYINTQVPEYLQFSGLKLLAATDMSSCFF